MSLQEFSLPILSLQKVDIVELNRLELDKISALNAFLFNEQRIINSYDHEHIIALLIHVDGIRAGFKIGYGKGGGVFYSAKGGIMPAFRRNGFARLLTREMMLRARELGYETFEYDTFPNKGHEMLFMGLKDGFKVTEAGWNNIHNDIKIHLSVSISDYLHGKHDPRETGP